MISNKTSVKIQNIFLIADSLQETYKKFVKTFQFFQNPIIQKWIDNKMDSKGLLYKDPLIELNYQFEKGKSLQQMVKEGILHEKIPSIFNISPYKHQSEAIERNLKDKLNVIVSTGTSSGKSMCYWIPIINTCLEMKEKGLDGIKAIVIFPMNALANSQYKNLVDALKGKTQLKVGRYIGSTPYSKEEGEQYIEKYYSRKPYDCEILSRIEMQQNPPDILITNYVMLDLILTRHDDKKLFPDKYSGYLKYLVLDEIHTYKGNTGADVACLIRRLKQKTKSVGKLSCIGTSATIQDNKKNTSATSGIIEFSEKIFGEKFERSSLVKATFIESETPKDRIIPLTADITVKDVDIVNFDGSFSSVIPLAEKVLGRSLQPNERNFKGLGQLFQNQRTVLFIHKNLRDSAKPLKTLVEKYLLLRSGSNRDYCLRELMAVFLIGTVAVITVENEERPLLVPKLHLFFTQGQDISSSLIKKGPIPSVDGGLKCKTTGFFSYPLYFCRNCGHEFYSTIITESNEVYPRSDEDVEIGRLAYLTPVTQKNNNCETPEQWLNKKGIISKTYSDAVPTQTVYCPKCNKIESSCSCPEKLNVWRIPYPFQLCPSCNIFYTKQGREYSKLFKFNSTGRSSTTDILTSELLSKLEPDQKKLIIFTDNRQDTALQSAHMNEFQRRLNFRQTFHKVLKEIEKNKLRVSDIEIGRLIYKFLDENKILPNFDKVKDEEKDEFSSAPPPQLEYEQFLTFLAISDIMHSRYFLDLNIEKLGFLKIEYDGLDKLTEHSYMNDNEIFSQYSEEERYDYIRGILDVFRWNGAIGNEIFNNSVNLYAEWRKKLNEDILFDINKSHYNLEGYTFTIPKNANNNPRRVYYERQRVNFKKIAGSNTFLTNWTKKYFKLSETEKANEILTEAIEILTKAKFIKEFWTTRPPHKFFQIREGKILFTMNTEEHFFTCPKCKRTYFFKNYNKCVSKNDPTLEKKIIDPNHFYIGLYNRNFDAASEIHAKEHSAQVEGKLREQFENDFQDDSVNSLNVLVCTPTMELGIDIGDLSAVMMRNVPPDPSRYAQRAGRAGRKNQPSIIIVFCGTGFARGPHDQYFYRKPEKIVSGKIEPPNFLLDNKKLIRRHLHASIFENLNFKISQKLNEVLDLNNNREMYPFHSLIKNQLIEQINANKSKLIEDIKKIFKNEIEISKKGEKFLWMGDDEEFFEHEINRFFIELENAFNPFREEYILMTNELDFLHEQRKKGEAKDKGRYGALARKRDKILKGEIPFTTYSYLSNIGFLPNYGFPGSSASLTMYNPQKNKFFDSWRSAVIAIREYAPHNQVYFLGNKYRINKAMIQMVKGDIFTRTIYVCPKCSEILRDTESKKVTQEPNCPICDEPIVLSQVKSCILFPHMSSISGERITCDEETRQKKGYEVTMNYQKDSDKIRNFELESRNDKPDDFSGELVASAEISYEHNGKIFIVNKGSLIRSKTTTETTLQPFYFCSACHKWLTETNLNKHIEQCDKGATSSNLFTEGYWLYVEGNHDVMVFNFPIVQKGSKELDTEQIHKYYTTLKETVIQALLLTFNLDESEISGYIKPILEQDEQSIVIFETEEGGTGVLSSLLDLSITKFDSFIKNMANIVHIESFDPYRERKDACLEACYSCLLRFRNQFEHKLIDRNLVISLIKQLDGSFLKPVSKEEVNIDEKIKKLKEKCDSLLEKIVLDEIVIQKLPIPLDAQKIEFDGEGIPIVKADFYYKSGNNGIYVFVDGPPHQNEMVAKKDKEKRDFLESRGNIVVELDFKDGKYVENTSLITKEVQKLKDYIS